MGRLRGRTVCRARLGCQSSPFNPSAGAAFRRRFGPPIFSCAGTSAGSLFDPGWQLRRALSVENTQVVGAAPPRADEPGTWSEIVWPRQDPEPSRSCGKENTSPAESGCAWSRRQPRPAARASRHPAECFFPATPLAQVAIKSITLQPVTRESVTRAVRGRATAPRRLVCGPVPSPRGHPSDGDASPPHTSQVRKSWTSSAGASENDFAQSVALAVGAGKENGSFVIKGGGNSQQYGSNRPNYPVATPSRRNSSNHGPAGTTPSAMMRSPSARDVEKQLSSQMELLQARIAQAAARHARARRVGSPGVARAPAPGAPSAASCPSAALSRARPLPPPSPPPRRRSAARSTSSRT